MASLDACYIGVSVLEEDCMCGPDSCLRGQTCIESVCMCETGEVLANSCTCGSGSKCEISKICWSNKCLNNCPNTTSALNNDCRCGTDMCLKGEKCIRNICECETGLELLNSCTCGTGPKCEIGKICENNKCVDKCKLNENATESCYCNSSMCDPGSKCNGTECVCAEDFLLPKECICKSGTPSVSCEKDEKCIGGYCTCEHNVKLPRDCWCNSALCSHSKYCMKDGNEAEVCKCPEEMFTCDETENPCVFSQLCVGGKCYMQGIINLMNSTGCTQYVANFTDIEPEFIEVPDGKTCYTDFVVDDDERCRVPELPFCKVNTPSGTKCYCGTKESHEECAISDKVNCGTNDNADEEEEECLPVCEEKKSIITEKCVCDYFVETPALIIATPGLMCHEKYLWEECKNDSMVGINLVAGNKEYLRCYYNNGKSLCQTGSHFTDNKCIELPKCAVGKITELCYIQDSKMCYAGGEAVDKGEGEMDCNCPIDMYIHSYGFDCQCGGGMCGVMRLFDGVCLKNEYLGPDGEVTYSCLPTCKDSEYTDKVCACVQSGTYFKVNVGGACKNTCQAKYYFDGARCTPENVHCVKYEDNTCTGCVQGAYMLDNDCRVCGKNCRECEDMTGKCIKCSGWDKKMTGGTCKTNGGAWAGIAVAIVVVVAVVVACAVICTRKSRQSARAAMRRDAMAKNEGGTNIATFSQEDVLIITSAAIGGSAPAPVARRL